MVREDFEEVEMEMDDLKVYPKTGRTGQATSGIGLPSYTLNFVHPLFPHSTYGEKGELWPIKTDYE